MGKGSMVDALQGQLDRCIVSGHGRLLKGVSPDSTKGLD